MSFQIDELDTDTFPSFKKTVRRLPPDIREHVKKAMKDLLQRPIPQRRRFEQLSGSHKPPIYTIHVTPNHSHKMSFELHGTTAVLRRVATHKKIDRAP